MAKYGFSTAIPYGTDIFEVTGVEYCEWEDALEKCDGNSLAMEWATYDVLINNGYFVSEPKEPRPAPVETGTKENVVVLKPLAGEGQTNKDRSPPGGFVNPGIRDVPDGFTLISGDSREPAWSQSRILIERDKLLKERERIASLKEEALQARINRQRWNDEQARLKRTVDLTFYNPNGKPYTLKDWLGVIVAAIIVVTLLIAISK